METATFTFAHQAFELKKETSHWDLVLARSEIGLTNLDQLHLLEVASPYFLPQSYEVLDDAVQLSYQLPEAGVSFSSLAQRTLSERLRFCLNLLELEAVLAYPFGLILHPDNLFVTKDLRVLMAYRSLQGFMVPTSFHEEDFLRQAKSLIIGLFTGTSFSQLYEGSLEVIKLPSYLEAVRASQDLEALRTYLTQLYQDELAKEKRTQILVSKLRFRLYKQATIWLSALAVLLVVPLVYLVFFRGPFQAKLLAVDRAFLAKDYTAVVNDTEKIKLSKLPYTQKYEIAYAYVQGLDFSDEQREVVMNNISLKSDELYLDYWIHLGRGESDQAVDVAKRLDDVDLILYALSESITATRKDNRLSGDERNEKLQSLQSEYDQYWKEREDALNPDDNKSSLASTSQSSSSAD